MVLASQETMSPKPDHPFRSGLLPTDSTSLCSTGRVYVETSVTGETQKTWHFNIVFDLDNVSTKVRCVSCDSHQDTYSLSFDKSVEIHALSPNHVSITTAQCPLSNDGPSVLGEKRKNHDDGTKSPTRKRVHHSHTENKEEVPLESETEPEFDPSQARGALEDEMSPPPPPFTQLPRSRRS